MLKTLLDRKLVATAGRKDVIGKPIMYKTTKEFLIQFGLSSLNELPTLKEFEELGRLSLTDETPTDVQVPPGPTGETQMAQESSSAGQPADSEAEPASEQPASQQEVEPAADADAAAEPPETEASEDNSEQTEPHA